MNLFSNYAGLSSASKSEELVHVCEDYKKGKY